MIDNKLIFPKPVDEVSVNTQMISITRNPAALDPDTTRDAWGIRMVYEPAYRQALPGIDLTVPVGVGYFPKGTSSVVGNRPSRSR